MRINHNLPALNTYRQLNMNEANGAKSTEKLSSGLRINRAGDDAAGLAISEKMRGQIRGLDQASRNSQDAISMIQTAEGALNETHDILQRMRELAVQASTDTNTASDRGEIQKEVNSLTSEINRIGNTTEFNTQKLLNGDKSNVSIDSNGRGFLLSGAVSSATATITAGGASVSLLESGANKLNEGDYHVVITSTSTSGTTGGVYSGAVTTTTQSAGSISGSGSYTPTLAAVTYSITGTNPLFSGDLISFTSGTGSNVVTASTSGDLVLTRNTDGSLNVHFSGTGSPIPTSGLIIDENIAVNSSGKFDYNSNGIQFTITDFSGMASGDTVSYHLNSGTATAGTAQSIWDTVNVSGATAPTSSLFQLSGAAQGTYTITISTSGAASASGIITVTAVNSGGSGFITNTFSGVQFTAAGLDFEYSGNGLHFTLSGLNHLSGDTNSTMSFSTFETTTTTASHISDTVSTDTITYVASLQDASGNELASGGLGTSTTTTTKVWDSGAGSAASGVLLTTTPAISGLSADYSGDIGGVHLSVAAGTGSGTGASAIDGSGAFTVNAIIEEVAKSGESSVAFQIGANQNQSLSLEIADMRANSLGLTRSAAAGTHAGFQSAMDVTNGTNNTAEEYALDFSTSANAANAITVIQSAIDSVSSERSKLGATQNRLEHTINNLGTSSENLTASESRIRDVDMAKEIMSNTRNNILAQAAQAMLAQANQAPQSVLQLLR